MNGFVANDPSAPGAFHLCQEEDTKGGSLRREVRVSSRKKTQKTQNGYPFGDANAVIDPMGIETRWENDQAGRRTRLIEGIANARSKD